MKKLNILQLTFLIFLALFFMNYSSGPAAVNGNGYTGAPGESFTCGGCHSNGAFGTTSVTLEVRNAGGSLVTIYNPGETYDLTLSVNHQMGTPAAYGFQMVALNDADNSTGTFGSPGSNMGFVVGNSGRTYAEHNMRSVSNQFLMEWTAPTSGTGDVTFHYAGNAVNSAAGTGGDNGSVGFSSTLSESLLPVELMAFTVKNYQSDALLSWTTASEINNAFFEVEHSQDGIKFTSVEKLAGAGNSNEYQDYEYLHRNMPVGENFYRLKQVDLDGQFSYSKTVSLRRDLQEIAIFPNPVNDYLTVSIHENTVPQHIQLFDRQGRKIKEFTSDFQRLAVGDLDRGWYQLVIFMEKGTVIRKGFVRG